MPGIKTTTTDMVPRFRRFQLIRALKECNKDTIVGATILRSIENPENWDGVIHDCQVHIAESQTDALNTFGEKAFNLLTLYNTSE